MGNASSKITSQGHHVAITEEVVQEVRSSLPRSIKGQDQAVAVLLHWFASMAKDSKRSMFGSVCFAGQGGEALEKCIIILSTSICGYVKIREFDMLDYSTADTTQSFLSDLKGAHGSSVIVFRNIVCAHPDASTTINQLIQTRAIAKHKPYIPYNFNFWDEKLDYSGVIFVGVHTPPLFSTQRLSSKQIVEKSRRVLGKGMFDEVVPFF